ncbi:MAG: cytochrome c biogenesis protein CcdA [candidate division WOR-3 bacterium]|jgi:cytochrome c-type biogenesis protein
MEVNIFTSFIAGFLSFLSPCVFPLIPAYISYISGISVKDLSGSRISINTILNLISFIFGFSIIFILFGASATFIGQLLSENKLLISKFAGLIVIIFGFHFIGILKIKKNYEVKNYIKTIFWLVLIAIIILTYIFIKNWIFLAISLLLVIIFNYFNLIDFDFLNYEKRFQLNSRRVGILPSFILGSSFAFGWTPCIGPILASILSLAAIQETVFQGIILLTFYSLGLAIPFFIAGVLTDLLLRSSKFIRKFFKVIEILSGLLLIILGVLIYNNSLLFLSSLTF